MIIINLKGGLGNQMFQYALGRKLSLTNKVDFKLDKTGYDREHSRSYALGIFNVIENFATKKEINKNKLPYKIISKGWRFFTLKILRLLRINWESTFIKKIKISENKDVYLDGYWQSYKYFEDVRDKITKDFSLKIPIEQTHPELLAKINSVNSVSLAVRRGDYLQPKNFNSLGICSQDYYKKAIELIESKVKDPVFFVFSEDIAWIKEKISFKSHQVFYISEKKQENSLTDYQEMILMSKCQHNIIANSSFSWWPAWLNQNPDKIVIAPDVWFTDGSIKIDDIIPPTWIKLPRD